MSQYLNKWKKKTSIRVFPSTIALKIDRKRRESNLVSPPLNKNVWTPVRRDETIYIYIPRIWHPTRRWEFASRRNSRNNSLCGRAEGAAESGIRKDLVVFEKAPETRNRDIHGGGRGWSLQVFGGVWREEGRGRAERDVMLMRRDATQRGAASRGSGCSTLPGSIYKIIPRNGGNKSLESWEAFLIR